MMSADHSSEKTVYCERLFENVRRRITSLSGTERMIANDFLQDTYIIEDGIDAKVAWLEELSADVEDMLSEMEG